MTSKLAGFSHMLVKCGERQIGAYKRLQDAVRISEIFDDIRGQIAGSLNEKGSFSTLVAITKPSLPFMPSVEIKEQLTLEEYKRVIDLAESS